MHEVFKILILSILVITFWTALLLLNDKRGIRSLNRWFAAFLIALMAPQMDLYVFITQGGIFTLSLVASTFLWLKGPFLCMFIKVLLRENLSLKSVWHHFLPWLIALPTLLLFPAWLNTFVLLGMGHMLLYLSFSTWKLLNHKRYISSLLQGFQNGSYYWLLYITGGLMALVAIDFIVMTGVRLGLVSTYDLLDYFVFPTFSLYALSIGIINVYRPEWLLQVTLESSDSHSSNTQNLEFDASFLESSATFENSRYLELNATLAKTLMSSLTELMEEQRLYQRNELSLPDLAILLGVSVNQVSELLNVHQGKSFYEYLTTYRVKHACDLLRDSNCHLRVLDIAFEAGFNNKNSFYRAFKSELGLTPAQYRSNSLDGVTGF